MKDGITLETAIEEDCFGIDVELLVVKSALQRLQFRYVAVKDCDRARNTVVVPTAAVAHLQPPVSSLDAMP